MIDTLKGIEWIIETLRIDQSPHALWAYPFDTGISTDAYMIILLRTLEINDKGHNILVILHMLCPIIYLSILI